MPPPARLLAIAAILVLSTAKAPPLAPAHLYVHPQGQDSNTGHLPTAALRTLHAASAAASAAASTGSRVFVHLARGHTHHGVLQVPSEATVESFGDAGLPQATVSAGVPVESSAWVFGPRPNTWVANVSVPAGFRAAVAGGEPVLVADGVALQNARSPNVGDWARVTSFNSTSGQVTFTGLPAVLQDVEGAVFRVRQSSYQYLEAAVEAGSASSLLLRQPVDMSPPPGSGFFVTNVSSFADAHGEWVVRALTATIAQVLLFWETGSPAASVFELGAHRNAVVGPTTGCKAVNVVDVAVTNALGDCVFLPDCDGATVNNASISVCGFRAVFANGAGTTVSGSTVFDVFGGGFTLGEFSTVTTSHVRDVGTRPGYGWSNGSYTGVICGEHCTLASSVFERIGYAGIRFAAHALVQANVFNGVMTELNDGGAVYTWNNAPPYPVYNVTVVNNIINGSLGNVESAVPGQIPWGRGIYMDDRVNQVVVHNNTVSQVSSEGIFLHGGFAYSVAHNTVYDAGIAALGMQDEVDEPVQGAVIEHNVLVAYGNASVGVTAPVCFQQTTANNITDYQWATFGAGNAYVSPHAAAAAVRRRVIEYRVPYHGPVALMSTVLWTQAASGDAGAASPVPVRAPYVVTATRSKNLVPHGALASAGDVEAWRGLTSLSSSQAGVTWATTTPPSVGVAPLAFFASNYGAVNFGFESPPFFTLSGMTKVTATVWAVPRFQPNPSTIGFDVRLCLMGGTAASGDLLCPTGTPVGQHVEVFAGAYAAAGVVPPTQVEFYIATPAGAGTVQFAVPNYSMQLYVSNVSVVAVDATPSPRLERLVVNPSAQRAAVPIPGPPGARYTALDGTGNFSTAYTLDAMQSVVLRCVSGC